MMFWDGGSWVWWQVLLMWTGMIAFWGALIWAAYYFVSASFRDSRRNDVQGGAKRILDERLARGEIDTGEYQRLQDALTSGTLSATHVGSTR